jgi:hypothetical protein
VTFVANQVNQVNAFMISLDWFYWSGKEALLPAPPPLRTVRAPFKAHGSSLSKRPLLGDAV